MSRQHEGGLTDEDRAASLSDELHRVFGPVDTPATSGSVRSIPLPKEFDSLGYNLDGGN